MPGVTLPYICLLSATSLAWCASTEAAINGTTASTATIDVARIPSSGEVVRITKPVTKIISHQSAYYHGWATTTAGRDGTLFLVYSGGRDYHVCPFGRVDFMVSKDGGENWSWPRTVADSLTDDRDTGIVETKSGVLLASFYTSIAYQQHMNAPERLLAEVFGPGLNAELERWRAAEHSATQAERKADIGHWLIRSTDHGRTWTARYPVPGYNPHGPIALADGRVFYAAADGKKAAAWISTDDGLTWSHVGDLPTRAGELHAVEAGDGTLIVQVRDKLVTNGGVKQRTLQTESHDGGTTWSKQRFVTDGYPPHLVRLKDNTLVCTYGSRIAPLGIRAKISRDHGQSWSEEFFLTDDAPNWDVGYPSTVQLSDESLVTVWYEAPANSHLAALRQAKWRL
jgi:sialidase-1